MTGSILKTLLRPIQTLMSLLTLILNLIHVMDVLYKDKDKYTHVENITKDLIASILIDPLPI